MFWMSVCPDADALIFMSPQLQMLASADATGLSAHLDASVGRSKRQRFRPLQWWTCERIIMSRTEDPGELGRAHRRGAAYSARGDASTSRRWRALVSCIRVRYLYTFIHAISIWYNHASSSGCGTWHAGNVHAAHADARHIHVWNDVM